jgi:hypothetical protein
MGCGHVGMGAEGLVSTLEAKVSAWNSHNVPSFDATSDDADAELSPAPTLRKTLAVELLEAGEAMQDIEAEALGRPLTGAKATEFRRKRTAALIRMSRAQTAVRVTAGLK